MPIIQTINIEVSSKQVNLLVVPRVIIQNSCLFSRTSILQREREGAESAKVLSPRQKADLSLWLHSL